jgi:hypothetical protein
MLTEYLDAVLDSKTDDPEENQFIKDCELKRTDHCLLQSNSILLDSKAIRLLGSIFPQGLI